MQPKSEPVGMKYPLYLLACCVAVAATLYGLLFAFGSSSGQIRRPRVSLPANANAPILVELFTSQGCSSCPPADAVLAGVAGEVGVVAISRHVTYWDRLGWRDTLGREDNTILQRSYAARGVAGGDVYTPQAVVNGRIGLIGSRASALQAAIAAGRVANPVRLHVAHGRVTASLATQGTELRFIAVASLRIVRIGAGENGGRRIAYHNVVLSEFSVACTAEIPCSADTPAALRAAAGADRFAAVLQRRGGGTVLAARWLPSA